MADETGPRPVDPDIDVHVPRQRRELSGAPWAVPVAISLGAPLRYFMDRFVQVRHDSVFPWGTYAANATACLLMGFVAALALPGWAESLLATGFLGALSTYSTFGYETLRLLENGARFLAFANVAASVTAGLGAAVIGAAFTETLPL